MVIIYRGEDVTAEIMSKAAAGGRAERILTDDYAEARTYLRGALSALDAVARPWQNDCVAEAIDEIHRVIFKLEGPKEN